MMLPTRPSSMLNNNDSIPADEIDQSRSAKRREWLFLLIVVSIVVGNIVALPIQRSVEDFLQFWVGYWSDRSTGASVARLSIPITHVVVLWLTVFVGVFPLVPKVRRRNAAIITSAIAPTLVLHEFFFASKSDAINTGLGWVIGSNALAIFVITSFVTVLHWTLLRSSDRGNPNTAIQRWFSWMMVATSLILTHCVSRFSYFNDELNWIALVVVCFVVVGSCFGWIRSGTINGLLKGTAVGFAIPATLLLIFAFVYVIFLFVIGVPAVPGV